MYTLHENGTLDDLKEAMRTGQQNFILTKKSLEEVRMAAQQINFGVFDFDGTLNHRAQWSVLVDLMPDSIRLEDESDLEWYLGLSQQPIGFESPLHHPDWFHQHHDIRNQGALEGALTSRAVDRFKRGGMTRAHVRDAGLRIRLREGVQELFDLVPNRVVISYGIEQLIEACLTHHNLQASIAATRLRFDEQDRLIGYEPNVVVTTTKPVALDRFIQMTQASNEQLLVMGDSIGDVHMMREGSLNVLMLPCTDQTDVLRTYRQGHLEEMWDELSVVVLSESLLTFTNFFQDARLVN